MAKKKKIDFLLKTSWMLSQPIDYEHKQYVLLDYLQKVEKKLNNLEVYPSFIEISLHFANIQTLIKENRLIETQKKFDSLDDEVLMSDLEFKEIETMSPEDYLEYQKILKFASPKIFDYFNIAKSIWQMAYEAVSVSNRANKKSLINEFGYFYYVDKFKNKTFVWEYKFEKVSKDKVDLKQIVNLIYEGDNIDLHLIVENFSDWTINENKNKLPVFEVFASESYPLNETLLPIFKRKIQSYIIQTLSVENYKKITQ